MTRTRFFRRCLLAVLLAAGVLAPGLVFAQAQQIRPEQAWATPGDMKIPESVLYDPDRQVIYVSNINGDPAGKDGNGHISRLSPSGEVLDLQWVGGLNAPKGLAVSGNRLFVADIDTLVEIDIEQGRVVSRYAAPDAHALNDVAVDGSGQVYVSNRVEGNGAVYRLSGGSLRVWVQGPELALANGLLAEADYIVVGVAGGKLLRVAYDTGQIETLADLSDLIQAVDGLARLGADDYLASDWTGNVVRVSASRPALGVAEPDRWQAERILSTAEQNVNAADIGFNPEHGLLLVPTFTNNRVVAYRLEGWQPAPAGDGAAGQ